MKPGFILFVLVTLLSCSGFYHDNIALVSPGEFELQIANLEDPQIVDVRTQAEFNKGAIPGAVNIDLNDDKFKQKIEVLDKDKPVYVYCRAGLRSKDASKLIADYGFEQVYELEGGYVNWKKNIINP